QTCLRHLAIFAGGWTVEAAAAICEISLMDALDRLYALVDQSLVVRQTDADAVAPRFTLLETIRAFGLERLAASGEDDDARDRHAAYFHRLIADLDLHHAMPGDPAWFPQVALEDDNLRLALTRLAERGEALALNDLSAALDVYWATRSHFAECRFW